MQSVARPCRDYSLLAIVHCGRFSEVWGESQHPGADLVSKAVDKFGQKTSGNFDRWERVFDEKCAGLCSFRNSRGSVVRRWTSPSDPGFESPRHPYELMVTASVKALGENCTHQKKNPLRTRNVRAFVMTRDSTMSGGIDRCLKMQKSKSDFSATAGEGSPPHPNCLRHGLRQSSRRR